MPSLQEQKLCVDLSFERRAFVPTVGHHTPQISQAQAKPIKKAAHMEMMKSMLLAMASSTWSSSICSMSPALHCSVLLLAFDAGRASFHGVSHDSTKVLADGAADLPPLGLFLGGHSDLHVVCLVHAGETMWPQ
jgi:hypothetical protein